MKRWRRALVALSVSVVLALLAFIPVVPVDTEMVYGRVSLSCYYLGSDGINLQSRFYSLALGSFSFNCRASSF